MASWLVIGAGISGLTAAAEVFRREPGATVTVLEGSDRVGGKLRRGQVAGLPVDVGAEATLVRRPEAVDLVAELGLARQIRHPTAAPAQVWSRGRLHRLPRRTLMGVPAAPAELAGLLTDDEVGRALAERRAPVAAADVSVGELVSARLGPAVTQRLVEPLLGGVYAGQADLISARAALPALLEAARVGERLQDAAARLVPTPSDGTQARSSAPVFATLQGGLHRLGTALAEAVTARGGTIRTGTLVRELRRLPGQRYEVVTGPRPSPTAYLADRVILATPAAATARLLTGVAPDGARLLAEVESASMAVLTFAFATRALGELTGSGVLVPPVEGRTIKAATFSATKWEWVRELGRGAGPDGGDLTLLRASVGRHREEASLQRSDAELAAAALSDLGAALGRPCPPPVDTHVQRWGGALPQYAVGHVDRVASVRAAVARVGGLAVCGAAYDGVGVPACIASARRAVAELHPTQ